MLIRGEKEQIDAKYGYLDALNGQIDCNVLKRN